MRQIGIMGVGVVAFTGCAMTVWAQPLSPGEEAQAAARAGDWARAV